MRKQYGDASSRANKFDIREFEGLLDQLSELRQHFLDKFDEDGEGAVSPAAEDRAWSRAVDVLCLRLAALTVDSLTKLRKDVADMSDNIAGTLRAEASRILGSMELLAFGLPEQPAPVVPDAAPRRAPEPVRDTKRPPTSRAANFDPAQAARRCP